MKDCINCELVELIDAEMILPRSSLVTSSFTKMVFGTFFSALCHKIVSVPNKLNQLRNRLKKKELACPRLKWMV